jgi:uncharacterized protein (DUF433 family)/DNA-binding transcriptional MerR regulator
MAFPTTIASVLTGASKRQLGYWRRPTAADAPLLIPATKRDGRYLYSWADIVALRSIVYLRQEKSLPKIRRAVGTLRALEAEEWEHLASYKLVRTQQTIVVVTPNGQILDVEHSPGNILSEVLMGDVLGPFQRKDGRLVPDLRRPLPYLTVNPRVLGGYPVIRGSRVPFHVVAALADDGVDASGVTEIYPSVDERGIPDARTFAEQVAQVA